jgi:hypothetical protein
MYNEVYTSLVECKHDHAIWQNDEDGEVVSSERRHMDKEAWLGGVDAAESQRKQKATAEERLCSQDKRISAGLLVAAVDYQLNSDIRDYVKAIANIVWCENTGILGGIVSGYIVKETHKDALERTQGGTVRRYVVPY